MQSGKLIQYLRHWVPDKTNHLFDVIYQLHLDMAAGGFWERTESELTLAWLLDLIEIGYKVPELVANGTSPITVDEATA